MGYFEQNVWQHVIANPKMDRIQIAAHFGVDVSAIDSILDKAGDADPERIKILNRARELTVGDRNEAYGPPWDNLNDCAKLVSAYINGKYDSDLQLTAEDVAHFMQLVKMARTFHGEYRPDNYIDNAAYGAIAGECRKVEEE